MLKIESFYKKMTVLSKREKLILYGAILFISVALLDRLIIDPIYSKMRSLDEEIREKETGITRSLRILSHKERILADSAKYSSFLDDFKSEEEEMTSILKEIEAVAEDTAIYLVDMKPGGVKEAGSTRRYVINLNCEAPMEQLVEFIYMIEESDALLTIQKYQITRKSKENGLARCKLTISTIVVP